MRRTGPCKRDGNHDEIARFAESIPGCVVVDTHEVGPKCIPGFPDLLLLWRGAVIPVEVKIADGKLTTGEAQLAAEWAIARVSVRVVRTTGDVLRVLGLA